LWVKNVPFRQFSGSFEPDLLGLHSFCVPGNTKTRLAAGAGSECSVAAQRLLRSTATSLPAPGLPPLGALNRDTGKLPRIKSTLGGEEFPFRIYGGSGHRPDRELDGVILDPAYREAGCCVIWGPSFESESEGLVRKFKLSQVTPEGHPEPEYHEG
jgi:hypothetical protein